LLHWEKRTARLCGFLSPVFDKIFVSPNSERGGTDGSGHDYCHTNGNVDFDFDSNSNFNYYSDSINNGGPHAYPIAEFEYYGLHG
jgi:hypothetical protein